MNATSLPQILSPNQLQALSQDVKQSLMELYGGRLNRIVLYGSYARGDFHAESDVDYMVVLNDEEVKPGQEIRYMIDRVYDLSDAHHTLISVKPASLKKYLHSDLFLYQNARREGKII
ncbi:MULTISPECIES: nucleotidyltransferase domain-containing protein [unclassified Spirosoma]|uniref:nucleotidyltransferase domain-containing protein n=1 Tax=unclassified Spirosoma TaxID=2621999 RepID=UPI0009699151|nr:MULTISPECIES: nucleotidyltransferase domain-containing protein [unclassified Spirosoma]MBN8826291.1 nucleotidyltransferase domain-containing protein [Spirosoma sp.]OJW75191.1 MAG: DNA polymerase subunit beta [Spirosoma sp. 48-14]